MQAAPVLVLNPNPMPHKLSACVIPERLTAEWLRGLTGCSYSKGFSAIRVLANEKPCTMVVDREQYESGNMPVNADASRILTETMASLGGKLYSRLIVRGSAVLFNGIISHNDGTENKTDGEG